MIFTDEDLEILKRWSGGDASLGFDDLPKGKLAAMIARMEAAEWVAERFLPLQNDPTEDEKTRIRAWREAAGK